MKAGSLININLIGIPLLYVLAIQYIKSILIAKNFLVTFFQFACLMQQHQKLFAEWEKVAVHLRLAQWFFLQLKQSTIK